MLQFLFFVCWSRCSGKHSPFLLACGFFLFCLFVVVFFFLLLHVFLSSISPKLLEGVRGEAAKPVSWKAKWFFFIVEQTAWVAAVHQPRRQGWSMDEASHLQVGVSPSRQRPSWSLTSIYTHLSFQMSHLTRR